MTVTCKRPQPLDQDAYLKEMPTDSALCSIGLFAGRDRLVAEVAEATRQFEIEQEVRNAAAQRRRSVRLNDPLEDAFYSLVSAAAVIALVVGVLCLQDFTTGRAQPGGIERSSTAASPESVGPAKGHEELAWEDNWKSHFERITPTSLNGPGTLTVPDLPRRGYPVDGSLRKDPGRQPLRTTVPLDFRESRAPNPSQ
jgi:hypothetical protein